MIDIEIKRKELELVKVRAARAEIEFRILEKQDEIERLLGHIENQKKHEAELEKMIQGG